ncbi:MAG: phenylalanine--tRNA ligase subunit beta [Rhodanobacteraceae bacterium]|jgi:phenylalanyl-tRNA synthetase beta chain|nr:phenylalanine--tRNA ligase subunit beta [Rhodanobacteraceae bacterium]
MKFSENWLRELVDIPVGRDELMHRLTMAGLEVEGVEALGAALDGVVVGEIVGCEPHPNADKLRVCQVAIGAGEALTIVCGAPNARLGLKAPLATIGTTMPNGLQIKKAALRGVESNGMLCSARELGIDADASGLMELPPDAPVGQALATYLGLPDASIEIKLTPNRPDCLSVHGLARDTAALFGGAFEAPAQPAVDVTGSAARDVRLDAGADCPRYLGRVIEGIDASAPTPLWLAERLRRSGLRPISAVVDVTNYVMLELGQPLHAFDHDTLDGGMVVRRGRDGETLKLLDGSEATLGPDFLMIADAARPLAIAGVMGGFDSRVTDTTRNVFLESAHFAPAAITGRARKLGLHTDASHRFERGVDPDLPRRALERASALLVEIAGGQAGPVTEAVRADDLPVRAPIVLRRARLARLLALDVADAEVERILAGLGLVVERTADGWRATPPSWRFDLAIEEDLIEEVVRVYGYERVPTRAPRGDLRAPALPEALLETGRLRTQLAARDYTEALCYAFVGAELLAKWSQADGAIALANPLSAELGVMRTALLPGLVDALATNRRRQQARVRLFEVGNVFRAGPDGPVETLRIAGVACGAAVAEQWGEAARAVDFFDVKGDIESLFALTNAGHEFACVPAAPAWLHPGHAAQVRRGDRVVGHVGALHPDLLAALGLDEDVFAFELEVAAIAPRPLPKAAPLSRFPSVRRDLSFELPEDVPYAQVEAAVRAAVGETLTDVVLFDRYAGANLGAGVKSLAMGLILQDRYRTLTDQDADRCMALAVAALESGCKAKLRG